MRLVEVAFEDESRVLEVVALILLRLPLPYEVLGLLNLQGVVSLLCCAFTDHLHLHSFHLKELLLQAQRHCIANKRSDSLPLLAIVGVLGCPFALARVSLISSETRLLTNATYLMGMSVVTSSRLGLSRALCIL